jgi:hypothetical protein
MPPALQQIQPPFMHDAVSVHGTKVELPGHWLSSTQVEFERQQTAAPSACEQLAVFAHAVPTGCVPVVPALPVVPAVPVAPPRPVAPALPVVPPRPLVPALPVVPPRPVVPALPVVPPLPPPDDPAAASPPDVVDDPQAPAPTSATTTTNIRNDRFMTLAVPP